MERREFLRTAAASFAAFSGAWAFDPPSVQAENETWQVKSTYPCRVQ
jgi:hypothetical protein